MCQEGWKKVTFLELTSSSGAMVGDGGSRACIGRLELRNIDLFLANTLKSQTRFTNAVLRRFRRL